MDGHRRFAPAKRKNERQKNQNRHVDAYRVQVLDRTFRILDMISDQTSGIGLIDIADNLNLHKSTAHRLMMVLESNRYIEKNEVSGKYHLGSRLIELGLSAVSRLKVYEVAIPHLRSLVEWTGETAHLGILRESEVVSLVNVESRQSLRTPSTVGARTPVHCTSLGKAMLAFAPQPQIDDFLHGRKFKAYTKNTITSASRFLVELRAIRTRGYSVDNEEREEGLRCIGAPIRDSSADVVAAVSIAGPIFRIREADIPKFGAIVKRVAGAISASLGYSEKTFQVGKR